MTWGHGDLEHPQAQYFLAKTVCICTDVYISLKSQNHTESFILKKKKKKSLPIALPKMYMCVFCYNS